LILVQCEGNSLLLINEQSSDFEENAFKLVAGCSA